MRLPLLMQAGKGTREGTMVSSWNQDIRSFLLPCKNPLLSFHVKIWWPSLPWTPFISSDFCYLIPDLSKYSGNGKYTQIISPSVIITHSDFFLLFKIIFTWWEIFLSKCDLWLSYRHLLIPTVGSFDFYLYSIKEEIAKRNCNHKFVSGNRTIILKSSRNWPNITLATTILYSSTQLGTVPSAFGTKYIT